MSFPTEIKLLLLNIQRADEGQLHRHQKKLQYYQDLAQLATTEDSKEYFRGKIESLMTEINNFSFKIPVFDRLMEHERKHRIEAAAKYKASMRGRFMAFLKSKFVEIRAYIKGVIG